MSIDYWWLVGTLPPAELDLLRPRFQEYAQRFLAQPHLDEALALWRNTPDLRLHVTAEMLENVPDERWGLRTTSTGEHYPAWPPSPQTEEVYVDGRWMRGPSFQYDDTLLTICSAFNEGWDPAAFGEMWEVLDLDDKGGSWELFQSNRVSARRSVLLALGYDRAMRIPGHLGMYLLGPNEVVEGLASMDEVLTVDEVARVRFDSTIRLLSADTLAASVGDLSMLASIHRQAAASGQGVFSIECWT